MNNAESNELGSSRGLSRRALVLGTLAASVMAAAAGPSVRTPGAFAAGPVVVPPFTVANQKFSKPLINSRESSVGTWNNGDDPYKPGQRHCGQDYSGDDVVIAVASGWVRDVSQNYDGGYGWNVTLEHPNGMWSFYGHMADKAVVSETRWVNRGEQLGTVGGSASGNLTKYDPHCHLAIASTRGNLTNRNSSGGALSVNPVSYIRDNANYDDPTYEEGATLPVYDSHNFTQSTDVGSGWGNIYVDETATSSVATFISGPKQVTATATVAVTGLAAGQSVRIRIARLTNDSETVIDTAATATAVSDGSSVIYVNIAGIANLGTGRKLRLQATSTASGVRVTNVDVVTQSWAP